MYNITKIRSPILKLYGCKYKRNPLVSQIFLEIFQMTAPQLPVYVLVPIKKRLPVRTTGSLHATIAMELHKVLFEERNKVLQCFSCGFRLIVQIVVACIGNDL